MRGILRAMRPGTAESTKAIGDTGEARAAQYLKTQGMQIIATNFRVKGGEIDLIARQGAYTVFVEVRLRTRSDYGGAAESITRTKQRRIILAARHWLHRHGDTPCRFDCVLIEGGQMQWLQDAFSAD